MACGATTVKYLLFIFNFVFFVSGIAILVIGIVIKTQQPEFSNLYDTNLYGVSIVLIVVGCLVTVIAFFGCCGAIRESRCMLYTFAAFLSVIFVVEFAAGIASFVYRDELQSGIRTQMNKTLHEYKPDSKDSITSNWDAMQKELHCCGVNDPHNWEDVYVPYRVPDSCCRTYNEGCGKITTKENIYVSGCLSAMESEMSGHAAVIGGVGIGVAFIQILGIVFACCLASILKN